MSSRWVNTKWRQGAICEISVLEEILPEDIRYKGYKAFIAISHDCDIGNYDLKKEPFV